MLNFAYKSSSSGNKKEPTIPLTDNPPNIAPITPITIAETGAADNDVKSKGRFFIANKTPFTISPDKGIAIKATVSIGAFEKEFEITLNSEVIIFVPSSFDLLKIPTQSISSKNSPI